MMDPFFLFGIHGALVSGKIAALAVQNRQEAQKEFDRCNRYFLRTFRAKQMYARLPVRTKLGLFHCMTRWPYLFGPFIELISRGIPGHEDPEFFYRSFVGPDYEPPLPFRVAARIQKALANCMRGNRDGGSSGR
jgi:hypothetical protein